MIKAVAFVGCHLLRWLPDEGQMRAVIKSMVKCLNYIASKERQEYFGQSETLSDDQIEHLERLIFIEAESSYCTSSEHKVQNIWGQGFWRVGLYVSLLSVSRTGAA